MNVRVLVIDDCKVVLEALENYLENSGYEVTGSENAKNGLSLALERKYDIILLDLKLPDLPGLKVLEILKKERISTPVLVISGQDDISTAVDAMKLGAIDYFEKPINFGKLLDTIKHIIAYRTPTSINFRSRFGELIGVSQPMQNLYNFLSKASQSDVTILLEGENGVGKDLAARAIHETSLRQKYPFVTVNCPAIPDNLLESELFGYEKGAFTGASTSRQGKFEQASKGTIFLDEIGDMSYQLQGKILRTLQRKEIDKLGSSQSIQVNVRVISATNQNLKKKVSEGNFREDLYYRLSVFSICVPPLREHKEDIPVLVENFIEQAKKETQKDIQGFTREFIQNLMMHDFPGNVRELENIVRRAVAVAEHPLLDVNDLPMDRVSRETFLNLGKYLESLKSPQDIVPLDDLQKVMMKKAIEICQGNMNRAAELLGIGRATLYRHMASASHNTSKLKKIIEEGNIDSLLP